MAHVEISELLGRVLSKISGGIGDDAITFTTTNGDEYRMYHEQDCCENVQVDDIIGDLSDLLNSPILEAEERTNSDKPRYEGDESFTWTFYTLATIKGYVTIKWYGSSNGYYSEAVSFAKIQ